MLFGIGFALIARDRLKADGPFASPAFHLVALHAAVVVAPIALYFYAVHPAWAWMYWVDPAKLAALFVLPLMVGHAALVIGGWYISSFLIRKNLQGAVLCGILDEQFQDWRRSRLADFWRQTARGLQR